MPSNDFASDEREKKISLFLSVRSDASSSSFLSSFFLQSHMPTPTSRTLVFFTFLYLILLLFAISDLKRFAFHVHISRVDRVPVAVDIDFTSSLWYPILIGIIFNIAIILGSLVNLHSLFWQGTATHRLFVSTMVLLVLFLIRFIINIIVTRSRNGLSTPTLVERSFFPPSLSLGEELTTIFLDWLIKMFGLIGTLRLYQQQKQEQTMSVERRNETQLMSSFEWNKSNESLWTSSMSIMRANVVLLVLLS